MPFNSSTIILDGHKHRFIDTGSSKPTLLLLHGISCSLNFFEETIPLFSRSFRVLALDLLGFGGSDKPRKIAYSLELYSSLIKEFLDKTRNNENEKIFAVGHSMGGKYLLSTALLYPGSFDKLVLSNTDGFTEPPRWVRGISLPGIKQVLKKVFTSEPVSSKAFKTAFHNPEQVNNVSYKKNLAISRDKDAMETIMALNRNYKHLDFSRTGLRQQLDQLTIPVLILWGDHDLYISPSVAGIVHNEIPGSELYIFKNCGHSPMLECPESFSNKVVRFLLNDEQ
ncbi:alpha/beta hydrolase [Prosthecochloris sp.]|uniref:alpha/beta fold hydrolase n=1 Tax=Prosthecochloris sp. TaxID=290513 RepID=UPI0025F24513|nr:alpha/beta hydrolase [Prosthecochloris sp.]